MLVAGLASVKTQHADFPNLGKRMSPFERTPPWSVYIPPQDKVEVTADSDLELAVCSAPGKGSFPARLIRPEDVGVEHRGKGRNQRRVHNILPDSAEADCLLVVEVYTDEGPPVRGRRINMIPPSRAKRRSWKKPTITASIRRRALPSSGSTPTTAAPDACMAPYNHDVVMVPRGYHPVAAIAGYDSYYLNVMAGPDRKWLFTREDDHASDQHAGVPAPRLTCGAEADKEGRLAMLTGLPV